MKDVTIGNQQASDIEIGWLAGIIDGEGYIGFSRQNSKKVHSVRTDIQIVNCDPDVILKTKRILNMIGVNPYIRERRHGKKEETYSRNFILSMAKFADLKKVIDTVGHLLTGEKKIRAKLVIDLINSRMGKTKRDWYNEYEHSLVDRYFEIMKKIKIRGNPQNVSHLNDYQVDSRYNELEKV